MFVFWGFPPIELSFGEKVAKCAKKGTERKEFLSYEQNSDTIVSQFINDTIELFYLDWAANSL